MRRLLGLYFVFIPIYHLKIFILFVSNLVIQFIQSLKQMTKLKPDLDLRDPRFARDINNTKTITFRDAMESFEKVFEFFKLQQVVNLNLI